MLGLALAAGALSLPWSASQLTDLVAGGPAEVSTPRPDRVPARTLPAYVVEPAVRIDQVPVPRRAAAAGPARRLVIPSLGVDARVVDIGVTDGVLLPPDDPQTLGWWSKGAVPGAVRGGALITGHTVHTGGGAFDDLETLRPGERILVGTDKGSIRYAVTAVTVYRKATLADDARRVFSQKVPGRLVLVTCEDWNGSGYDSNAIVFAERQT